MRSLSRARIDAIVQRAVACADTGDTDGAWRHASALLDDQARNRRAAMALLDLVDRRAFSLEQGVAAVGRVFESHADDGAILCAIGSALEAVHDIRFLNGPPASAPIFQEVGNRLRRRASSARGTDEEIDLLTALATTARLLGRAWDSEAEAAYRRLVELRPERWQEHYNLGLFYKVRGRFAEGLAANQRAQSIGGAEEESVVWNLGICATGAGEGEVALAVWKAMGQRIEMGRFGLPEGGYPTTKVRLAQRPLAERSVEEDDPGLEETIWVERMSPCHGIIRNALFEDLGVDYGDVVLFDGAPITHHTYGERQVPVFPHLATLRRTGYRFWPFVGTQPAAGRVAALSEALPEDAILYAHSEQMVMLCARCWEDRDVDHGEHTRVEHRIVRGKLCAPPAVRPVALRDALDEAVAAESGVRVFVPELSRAIGDDARAEVETKRVAMISTS
jgi:hypothetical protein